MEAAREAQLGLREQVPVLPMQIAETSVRSFGRLRLTGNNTANPFCSTSALYPIGFCCDRYEFSPVHGRVLKLRCSILAGDRPVFRILWGPGVDEEPTTVDIPFDPDVHAAPLLQTGSPTTDAALRAALPAPAEVMPLVGMHVKVRFDGGAVHYGTVQSVTKKKRKQVDMTVQYTADEFQETFTYPDPDVVLLMPGAEDEANGQLLPRHVDGKPVRSVVGKSPIEAWGKLLIALGMMDEIIYDRAMETLESSRKEGMQEAKDKMEGKKKKDSSEMSSPSPVLMTDETSSSRDEKKEADDTATPATETSGAEKADDGKEPPSEEELLLLEKLKMMEEELKQVEDDHEKASIELCDARIAQLGPFLCNPFQKDENARLLQASWMSIAVRKEKTKMGSTGNKRKVVTAVDLLERNDTIANSDIEALLEGLPGSQFCDSYVFQAYRTAGGLSRSWIHEAQLKNEKETLQRLEHQQAKEEVTQERAAKRKQKEDLNATRKRQKVEEEEEKKKIRVDERLARLEVQVNDRLEKEAALQREKVVQTFSRSLTREYNRRRKTAEIVSAQSVIEGKGRSENRLASQSYAALPIAVAEYSEDVLRVWDFVSTFGDFFVARGFSSQIPSLETVQAAIDCVGKGENGNWSDREEAVDLLAGLAETLTKPLASKVTRMLFASLVALVPALQKEFGATFFNEVNAITDKKSSGNKEELLVPVNSMTWKEVARLTFLSDSLAEIGLQKHELSHLLRGYRSAGHPSSREFRALRKVEDFPTALILQDISNLYRADDAEILATKRFRIDLPCQSLRPGQSPKKDIPRNTETQHRSHANCRNGVGLLGCLDLSQSIMKEFVHQREGYMEDALLLKEEMERQKLKEQGEDVDEEDGDDDEDEDDSKSAASGVEVSSVTTKTETETTNERVTVEQVDTPKSTLGTGKNGDTQSAPADGDSGDGNIPGPEVTGKSGDATIDEGSGDTKLPTDVKGGSGNTTTPTKGSGDTDKGEKTKDTSGASSDIDDGDKPIGKETPYDDFCRDDPKAPELIRRCLAVLRAVAVSGPAEHFLYPVDPQTNPGYYDSILRPMCLREAGKQLGECTELCKKLQTNAEAFIEDAVAKFGRNIRLIGHNSLTYAGAGPTVITAGTEMLRLFERLFFHWVLAPDHLLPKLTEMDDEKCVEQHPSDEGSTVLLCDGCEGKYNVARLDPPLREIPRGDWYCPRCIKGEWWGDIDPRIGKLVRKEDGKNSSDLGCITKCMYSYPQKSSGEPSLRYKVEFADGLDEVWTLSAVDKALTLQGTAMPAIRCLRAVVESPGYSYGIDAGLRSNLVPTVLNPTVSDSAARMALVSSEFREAISAAGCLQTTDPLDMTAREWLRLLVLLVTRSAATDVVQNYAGNIEGDAAERMSYAMDDVKKFQIGSLEEILPPVSGDNEDVARSSISRLTFSSASPVPVATEMMVPPTQNKPPKKATPAKEKSMEPESVAVVVDARSVEIVDEMDIVKPDSVSTVTTGQAAILAVEKQNPFAQSNGKKTKRQKMLEDSFAAFYIKSQMKPTVASFPEDTFSASAELLLSPQDPQISFSNLRCKETTCVFCGLNDIALGSPLVRVPDEFEWEQLMAHMNRSRRVNVVAEIPRQQGSQETKLCSVTIKIGGEQFSAMDSDLDWIKDGGMLEFPLRARSGFQNDLLFRYETGLPFVTGSLSAHECCAASAHNARKERLLQKFKDEKAAFYEREEGLASGRTLAIGRDGLGRTYWKFSGKLQSLFICVDGSYKFYEAPENIASVIVGLRKDPVVVLLLEAFPKAKQMIADRSWTSCLFAQRFPSVFGNPAGGKHDQSASNRPKTTPSFKVDDEVLVKSKNGLLLWNAKVVEVSTPDESVVSYLVVYMEWGANYQEWVPQSRVLGSNDSNRQHQVELFQKRSEEKYGLPRSLDFLTAKDYIFAKDRSRGSLPLPDFSRIMFQNSQNPSWDERTFNIAKTALLVIEAALPIGAVDTREKGRWRSDYVTQWRLLVVEAEGPVALMKCVFHLEGAISEDWYKESHAHVRTALPMAWKSVADASPSSIVMRLVVLDRALQYKKVDKKRFARRKRKK